MPEKGFTVATYAAGASLATIALVYVFAPTYLIDSNPSGSSNPLSSLTSRKNGVVGLYNAANDCFINSVLQALAGLGDLRIYLIRETHRRKIDNLGVYTEAVPEDVAIPSADGTSVPRRSIPVWKIEGLQAGLVTKGLKDMIDQLNERPIVKKTISAMPFVRVLEVAFRQRISRQQQDAQEFLQIVAERLCDEYHAGQRARRYARQKAVMEAAAAGSTRATDAAVAAATAQLDTGVVGEKLASIDAASSDRTEQHWQHGSQGQKLERSAPSSSEAVNGLAREEDEDEDGFPMEGKIESQIECLTCGFRPRPSEQAFCTLTLNVPQVSSTSLSACFDTMLKTEYIDDFKCEKCRLLHAKQMFEIELAKSVSEPFRKQTRRAIDELQAAIDTDPEKPPADVTLPDVRYAPKRRIARHFRVVSFPKVLAIHLSRSIYDVTSQKNSAKVAFPERLPLGGLLHRRMYKLLGLVTHKGSHHSGHYESFRRQTIAAPYSNSNTFAVSTVYSPSPSPAATTPRLGSSEVTLIKESTTNSSPVSSVANLPPTVFEAGSPVLPLDPSGQHGSRLSRKRDSWTSSIRGQSASFVPPIAPTSAPRDMLQGERDNNSAADAVAETSSLRSITRSTLSRLTSSTRSGSRKGSRTNSISQISALQLGSNGHSSTANNTAAESGKKAVSKAGDASSVRRKKRSSHDQWWRISDERVREASTREVLGMQREVYLLFYELERDWSVT
ncbi:ubiquitin c-terminal hydrolase [Grosmannia clavigera kw1407]|uniref:Ubiquitin carboxyl-terminal hydrolase n=1 Tax=Grosmannia clavigera (strain kw1407 / UAMH 11150) TaxID=655863 RepID=F0XUZ3_GROCL|nr:ubiquitin c-terminal hydrolase [Grosmannia clavigera kw1407]EFW98785.1 ubiquitin c-terminal hydrolase [Grosmannia clavigera kw1407]